jgi:hypothetical protein
VTAASAEASAAAVIIAPARSRHANDGRSEFDYGVDIADSWDAWATDVRSTTIDCGHHHVAEESRMSLPSTHAWCPEIAQNNSHALRSERQPLTAAVGLGVRMLPAVDRFIAGRGPARRVPGTGISRARCECEHRDLSVGRRLRAAGLARLPLAGPLEDLRRRGWHPRIPSRDERVLGLAKGLRSVHTRPSLGGGACCANTSTSLKSSQASRKRSIRLAALVLRAEVCGVKVVEAEDAAVVAVIGGE